MDEGELKAAVPRLRRDTNARERYMPGPYNLLNSR